MTDGTPPERRPRRGVVRAAGGVVLREGSDGRLEVALVHRPAYDDWTFPKGKVRPGERHREAALREVEEETGLTCRAERELQSVRYRDRFGRDKVVRYWTMRAHGGRFQPNDEVDRMRWVPVDRAEELLTYDHDRALLGGGQASVRSGS